MERYKQEIPTLGIIGERVEVGVPQAIVDPLRQALGGVEPSASLVSVCVPRCRQEP